MPTFTQSDTLTSVPVPAPFKLNFWTRFAIQEAITVVQVLVAGSHLSDDVKAKLEQFIADGNALLQSF